MPFPHLLPHHCRCSSANLPPSLIRQGQTAAADEADAQGAAGVPQPQDLQGGGLIPSLDLPIDSWSEPPRDVLECVLDKLKEHRDILLFSSVCVAWRSFTLDNLQLFPRELPLSRCLPQQCQLPLLMLPSKDAAKACDFFCVFEQKFYGGTPLPDSNKWIWGSSKGWLVTVDIRGPEIYLFNPVSRDQIYLPSKTEVPIPKCDGSQFGFETFDYLWKAALSKSYASNIEDCVIMAVISTSCVLCFCRPGDSKWTSVPHSRRAVDDIIYYKEQFYAVNFYGVVLACDIGPIPKTTLVVGRPKMHVDDDIYFWKRYIVESQGGELLQLVRIMQFDGVTGGHITVEFKVFQLQEKSPEDKEDNTNEKYERMDTKKVPVEDGSYKWVKLDNLRNQVIFLGFNQSFSLPACELPNSRGNNIYFTDDYQDYFYARLLGDTPEVRTDMGVFNLDDGSVHPFHPKSLGFPMPPIWVSTAPW